VISIPLLLDALSFDLPFKKNIAVGNLPGNGFGVFGLPGFGGTFFDTFPRPGSHRHLSELKLRGGDCASVKEMPPPRYIEVTYFLYGGGGSLTAIQKTPSWLIAFMNSEKSKGFTT
jgi:hypothetical protein